VRWRRLFSATRFFLCIDGGGGVEGTRWRERPGSEWGRGRGRGQEETRGWTGRPAAAGTQAGTAAEEAARAEPLLRLEFSPSCAFEERIEENGYNSYASLRWRRRGRPMFLSLDSRGRPRRGRATRRRHLSTHFLPLLVA
ncbi:FGF22 factor, partial [Casuarius casuarius]|nr:FGF22 factor [Casuarius casuarius]